MLSVNTPEARMLGGRRAIQVKRSCWHENKWEISCCMKTFGIKFRRRLLTGMEFGNSFLQGTGAPRDSAVLRMRFE